MQTAGYTLGWLDMRLDLESSIQKAVVLEAGCTYAAAYIAVTTKMNV